MLPVFLRSTNLRLGAAAITFLIAGLACARGDIQVQTKMGSGENLSPNPSPIGTAATEPLPSSPPPTSSPTHTPARPEPVHSPTLPPTPTALSTGNVRDLLYESQPGDTLRSLAVRFGVIPDDIRTNEGSLPEEKKLIDPGTLLIIPERLADTGPDSRLIPDSEVVFSPHAAEFDVAAFLESQGGYLNRYREYVGVSRRTGAEVVELAAIDHSINPRLLLAFLEYSSGWVTNPDQPVGEDFDYPLGIINPQYKGLYRQFVWLTNELGKGYYGWRAGTLTDLILLDGSFVRLAPSLNAGTVALQYVFSLRSSQDVWMQELSPDGFITTYEALFGNPWDYYHPLYEPGIEQPEMNLPFLQGRIWSFTGGPHGAWEREAAWAALDFAPATVNSGCVPSDAWIAASAPGLVLRSEDGLVVVDLDGDGREQTGWVMLYLHVGKESRVREGRFLETGDLLGHPSCEGGMATGTHVHIVRKYNGEWILADGPLPFTLSGWVAHAGSLPYQGALIKGDQSVLACQCGSHETLISR